MVARVPAESARKSAPASDVRQVDEFADAEPVTTEARAASALAVRAYGSYPAPKGVPRRVWTRTLAEIRAFDRAHALDFAVLHALFARECAAAYQRPYARSLSADWIALRDLVRERGVRGAESAIRRAFDEPLLVGCGIESPGIVVVWADALLAIDDEQLGRDRSRLSAEQADLCRAVIAERESARGGA